MLRVLFFITILVCLGERVKATELDPSDQNALEQTQDLLKNQQKRTEFSKSNPDAKKADEMVSSLFGGDVQLSDEVYKMAADIFAQMVKESNGDSIKMQEKLLEFQRNPSAFAKTWSPEQLKKLKEISVKSQRHESTPRN